VGTPHSVRSRRREGLLVPTCPDRGCPAIYGPLHPSDPGPHPGEVGVDPRHQLLEARVATQGAVPRIDARVEEVSPATRVGDFQAPDDVGPLAAGGMDLRPDDVRIGGLVALVQLPPRLFERFVQQSMSALPISRSAFR
jgi:hypothetical protein